MVPVSQAWEVFPNEVQWLEFRAGTPQERADEAVQKAREASGLNKPLYELRIYSLEGSTFGQVLRARLIRAAHCLTSLQFSPTSDHLLVAYGRRFISLCNLVAEGRSLVPAHTVIEMYRWEVMDLA
jgi:activator-of-BECN1-regulated-autophagy protein 1